MLRIIGHPLLLIALSTWGCVMGQGGGIPPVGSDYNDQGNDGSFRFGFQTGDEGAHYQAAIGSKDNLVAGRFGSRDPSSGRVVETQYTAGRRGFRARGPNIARKMDLSQNKVAYTPPVESTNSPSYQPSYDTYFDPNEDPSYDFAFRTPTYSRKEVANSRGHVDGGYSFIDDVGERHDVRYEAGAKIGFNVKTPFPDSVPFSGGFYSGPSKPGGLPRGRTSIQQDNDGSYRFIAAGPDQRRTEVSDSSGNVRGSYTYIDDKGQQRTVEYIAGPNIGYKIVRKGVGGKIPGVSPFIPATQIYPSYNPVNDPFSIISPNDPLDGGFKEPVGSARPISTPRPTTPPSVFETTQSPFSTSTTPGNTDFFGTDLFFPASRPTVRPHGTTRPPNTDTNFQGYPSGRPSGPPFPPELSKIPSELPNNCCSGSPLSGKYSTTSTTARPTDDFFYPLSAFPEDDPSRPKRPKPSLDYSDDFLRKPFSELTSDKYFDFNGSSTTKPLKGDNSFLSSNGIPRGLPVRAHVHSIDLPYGSKIPPPGLALERGFSHNY